jgi:acyl carrier protein
VPTATEQPETIDREDVERRVRGIVARSLDLEVDEVRSDSLLADELGAQSLDLLDMAFMLEREFRIQFPRTDIWERLTSQYGEETLMVDGVITPYGRELLRRAMPETNVDGLRPRANAMDVMRLLNVETFVRIVLRLLEAKAAFPRACPACGTTMQESEFMPEFVCPACGHVAPLPSGDDILLQDLTVLVEQVEAERSEPHEVPAG